MAKDPAFLFYPADASEDTQFMNRLERGAYFDLVKSQRLFHGYTVVQLRKVLGKDFEEVWPSLELVLQKENDEYFIGWIRESITNRESYSKKQSDRIKKRWGDKSIPRYNHGNSTVIPIQKENGNGNEISTSILPNSIYKERKKDKDQEIFPMKMEEETTLNILFSPPDSQPAPPPSSSLPVRHKTKPKPKMDFIDELIDVFRESFLEANGFEFDITNRGKERSGISGLLEIHKKKNPGQTGEQVKFGFKTFFDQCNRIKDPFLQKKMSPNTAYTEIVQIKKILLNGNESRNSKGGATDRELAELFARKYGNQ